MSIPLARRRAAAQRARTNGFLRLTLHCVQNVFSAIDRREPEAPVLSDWLAQKATSFGIDESSLPEESATRGRNARTIAAADWHRIGVALRQAEAAFPEQPDSPVDRWLAAITQALCLDSLETRIFAVALHFRLEERMSSLVNDLNAARGGRPNLQPHPGLIALLLNAPIADVDRRLAPGARLRASGLLRTAQWEGLTVLERLQVLLRRNIPPEPDLYNQLLGRISAAALPWDAFHHLGREAEVAANVLRAALKQRQSGVNILLYGPVGTGKTSLAATLAEKIGAILRPVAEADENDGEPTREDRLAGLRLAQGLAASREIILLVDEAEDIFAPADHTSQDGPSRSRVFIHRMLERVSVPVIWTANDINVLGPAVLRRMTMCIELKVPNQATRTRLWRQIGDAEGVKLTDAHASRLARLVPAAPAVASAALRATRLAGGDADMVQLVVEGVARAVRGGALPAPEPAHDTLYHPALVNADCDLPLLLKRLTRRGADRAVSFLLSGPPGSGKSAWVRYLAERLGLPLVQKRASDILDPYVGGSERNIADAFAEARDTGGFLVFDEADSLLLSRSDAVRSWEVSQVNEMLTRMEQHTLPFACTTNMPDRLDRASLRRFAMKVRFDWLTPPQARFAFRRFLGTAPPPGLEQLRALTPADFAVVRRRAAMTGAKGAGALLLLLAAESEGRIVNRLPVGFRASGDAA